MCKHLEKVKLLEIDHDKYLQFSTSSVLLKERLALVVPCFEFGVLRDRVHVSLETRQVLLLLGDVNEFLHESSVSD